MKQLSRSQALWGMVAVTALWSTAGVVTRHLQSAQGFEITFWRSLFTWITLLLVLPIVQGTSVFGEMRKGGRLLWLSGLCWGSMMTTFMIAVSLTTIANVLITLALGPVFTAIVSRWILGRKLPLRTGITIGVACAGILWMYGAELMAGASLLGTAVALCVPIAASINWTVVQRAHEEGANINLVPAVLVGALLSSLAMLPMATPFQATAWDLTLLAGLGIFQLALPCMGAVYCAKVLHPTEVALLGLLEVIFGILLAWFGADETPTAAVLMGGSLVLGALAVNEAVGLRQRRQHKEAT